MEIKLFVICFEIPAVVKRWALRVGILALLVGGAAVAYAAPAHIWATGDALTADDLNGAASDLDTRINAVPMGVPVVTAWTAYTPTVTAEGSPLTVTTDYSGSTSTGYWRRVGDTLEVNIATTHPSCQIAKEIQWSFPKGLVADAGKLPHLNGYVGTAMTLNGVTGAITTANVLAQGDHEFIALQQGTSVVTCSTIGSGGIVRITCAVPIQGWKITN